MSSVMRKRGGGGLNLQRQCLASPTAQVSTSLRPLGCQRVHRIGFVTSFRASVQTDTVDWVLVRERTKGNGKQ